MADAKSAKNFALPPLPELRETRVFGRRICYYDVGSGMPLVLIHGVGGDADQWAFCMPALAASLRVIAIDLPGFGRSDKPQMDYRIAVSTRANMRLVFETMFHDTSLVTDDLVDLAYSLHLERGDHYAIQSVLETLGSPNEKIDHDLGRISMPTLMPWKSYTGNSWPAATPLRASPNARCTLR